MGFEGYTDQQLDDIVDHWSKEDPPPGSLGARAKRDSLVELERRRLARGETPD